MRRMDDATAMNRRQLLEQEALVEDGALVVQVVEMPVHLLLQRARQPAIEREIADLIQPPLLQGLVRIKSLDDGRHVSDDETKGNRADHLRGGAVATGDSGQGRDDLWPTAGRERARARAPG